MTSSMLAGERRWASARRGGMTVLGKVAVPKPLNLPSQKLENHGLDPNVEIVPKGSLSWGSRPSSSASNPWGSSGPSPTGDGSNGSPSHVSGRPSSGGSGTRPSTAGSDKMHEPTTTAWGPNSRPSSASGSFTSNQASLAPLRPHSAETRPGSSQLSRFAESLPDNSVAWGPTGNVDKLIIGPTKNDGFSLSSGDFPTLGSESSGKNTDSQDYGSHGHPSSSSAGVAPANDRIMTTEADAKSGMTNTWNKDGNRQVDDGVQPGSEKWQGGYTQQYMNANIPPQHFDGWHGPPVNAPAGVWYRGPPGGPPYGPTIGPNGFPIEPFPPYYRPQMPPPALGNSQPVAGPRGHHPKNGDLYRGQVPDPYMHPGMPIRPGFYPRPVAYENFYGPSMGYCNPNERDIPFMGMSGGGPVFNRYPVQNSAEHSGNHARAAGRGSSVPMMVSDQVESGRFDDTRVFMKQHDDLDAQEGGSWEHAAGDVPFLEKGAQPRTTFRKSDREADNRSNEEMQNRRTLLPDNSSFRNFDNGRGRSLNSVTTQSSEIVGQAKAFDRGWGKKLETAPSSFPDAPQILSNAPKDSTLLQKIEGLNAKARASDGRQDVAFTSGKEEEKKSSQFDIVKSSSVNEVATAAVGSERSHAGDLSHAPSEDSVSKVYMIHETNIGTSIPRKAHHGLEGRVEHRGKGRVNNPDSDAWRKKPLGDESLLAIPAANVGPVSVVHSNENSSVEAGWKQESADHPGKDDGDYLPIPDPSDYEAQRAKMRELAKKRAIQLQKEEEERRREQEAKARAKLEELDRRTQSGDGLVQKLEKAPPSSAIMLEQKSQALTELVINPPKNETPSSVVHSGPNVVAQTSESCTSEVESNVLSSDSQASKSAEKEIAAPKLLAPKLDVNASAANIKTAPQVNDSSVTKLKHTGYKVKHNIPVEKHFSESLISFGTIGAPDIHSSVEGVGAAPAETRSREEGGMPNLSDSSNVMPELLAPQRKKISKIGKNKNKPEHPSQSPLSALPSQLFTESDPGEPSTENGKTRVPRSNVDPGSVQALKEDVAQLSEQHSFIPSEESNVKMNNPWKSQPSRRMPKNGQANKVVDKSPGNDAAVWAPVRSHQKADVADESRRRSTPDAVLVTAKDDNIGQNSLRSKRAEMERYVPKPAQQGSIQQSVSSSFSQTTSDETAGRTESSVQRIETSQPTRSVGHMVESNTGDSKQSKQAKTHGAWKQRGSIEFPRSQAGSSLTLNRSKNDKKYMDRHETLEPDVNQVIAEPYFSDGWDSSDGWNMPEDPTAAATITSGTKDQGASKGKGKRHPYKGQRSLGNKNDIDQKNSNSGEINKKHVQSAALEVSQSERNVSAKENHGNGERAAAHWQPKSRADSVNSHTGSRFTGGQRVHVIEKDSPHISGDLLVLDKERSEVIPQHLSDQSLPKTKSIEEATNLGHQQGRRERMVASAKQHPQSQNLGFDSTDQQAPESEDAHLERRFSSGFRGHGNQNNRTDRRQESHSDWNSVGQDNRHQNAPGNRERHPRNSHYEYQPVGPYNNSKSNNFEGVTDGSRNMGSRYRERGQSQSRRGGGNSYVRKSGAIQVDASYD